MSESGQGQELPQEALQALAWLRDEVAALHRKWDFHLNLFNLLKQEELFEVASIAFMEIFESLHSDLVMSICRLGDPLQSCRKDNLSFVRLEEYFKDDATLKELIRQYGEDTSLFRTHRNKRVGHNDLRTLCLPTRSSIQSLQELGIDTALASAAKILDHVARRHFRSEYRLWKSVSFVAENLVYWLKRGWDNRLPPEPRPPA